KSSCRVLLAKSCFILKPDIDVIKPHVTGDLKDRFNVEFFKIVLDLLGLTKGAWRVKLSKKSPYG
ncbi:hypothetical protein WFH67_21965, partial [Vibrio vulnificus]|uniref:hypothetical protein n=1 Tax=Vibrio vulnificus TaxID=672 RepID=UPI00307D9862